MEDLNIKAVLLDEESEIHNSKLFDSQDPSNKQLSLSKGDVIDTSRMRGQLIGFTKNKHSYVGQKTELFHVIKTLSSMSNPCPLVHIRGFDNIGKTRFV